MAEGTRKIMADNNKNEDIILTIENLRRIYKDDDGADVEALEDVSLKIKRGEFISIIGASGCGKTTLLRSIAGLDKPDSGSIVMDDHPITKPDPKRGYVFQQGGLFNWLTVEQNISYGLKTRRVYKQKKDDVAKYIELVGEVVKDWKFINLKEWTFEHLRNAIRVKLKKSNQNLNDNANFSKKAKENKRDDGRAGTGQDVTGNPLERVAIRSSKKGSNKS